MARTLRLAIVADIHHGRSLGTKKGHAALSLLTSVRDRIDPLGLDLIVDLGDRINNIDHKTDLGLMRDVADVFDTFGTPRAHLLGNHDNDALTRQDVERVMGVPFTSHSLNLSGYHLVFWNANTHLRAEHGFSFAPGDLDWLREDIASTTLPTIVFSHVPLDNGSMIGNYYFENYFSNSAHYDQGHLARDIIERSGRVVLCVSGHTHWNARNTIDGVHYVTVQSLTESFTTWPEPAEGVGASHN